jgi:hypothetical protein
MELIVYEVSRGEKVGDLLESMGRRWKLPSGKAEILFMYGPTGTYMWKL